MYVYDNRDIIGCVPLCVCWHACVFYHNAIIFDLHVNQFDSSFCFGRSYCILTLSSSSGWQLTHANNQAP